MITLKENITNISLDMPLVTSPNKREIHEYEIGILKLEQIAKDFAIEFAEWVIDTDDKPVGQFTITELLEIFKKEKGL
jgi:hypothetical protein